LIVMFGLPETAVQKLCSVFSRYSEIESVLLYGSRAMGTWRNGSDIDLCIVAEKLSFSKKMEIENEIDDLLLPWKVDLSLQHQLENSDLLDHIQETIGQALTSWKNILRKLEGSWNA